MLLHHKAFTQPYFFFFWLVTPVYVVLGVQLVGVFLLVPLCILFTSLKYCQSSFHLWPHIINYLIIFGDSSKMFFRNYKLVRCLHTPPKSYKLCSLDQLSSGLQKVSNTLSLPAFMTKTLGNSFQLLVAKSSVCQAPMHMFHREHI